MSYRDVFKGDVEFLGSFEEIGPDAIRDSFSLGNELCGIELGYYSFENFVSDRW
jgi:hypothetical protein